MAQHESEEKYPLLSLFLDDGKSGSKKSKAIFIERGRSKGILSGATNVLTEWPSKSTILSLYFYKLKENFILDHMTACWMTTLFSAFALLLLLIFAAALQSTRYLYLPKCLYYPHVHNESNSTPIYLVHHSDKLTEKGISAIEDVVRSYPNFTLHLTILQTSPASVFAIKGNKNSYHDLLSAANNMKKRKLPSTTEFVDYDEGRPLKRVKRVPHHLSKLYKTNKSNKFFDWFNNDDFNINIGSKNLLNLLMKRRFDLDKSTSPSSVVASRVYDVDTLLKKYPHIVLRNRTVAAFFRYTPLYYNYYSLSPTMQVFAARVVHLWDHGGISFDIDSNKQDDHGRNVRDLIEVGLESFQQLPEGIVTIDDEGLHMETKTSCHAFFGELLMNVRMYGKNGKVQEIIKKTLSSFCQRGAVDSNYCANMMQL